LAITDHDTLDGLEEALQCGKAMGVWVIPGIEISVDVGDGRSFHLLGYGVESEAPPLRALLGSLTESRAERNQRVMERLARLGYPLEEKDLDKPLPQAGRPHLARALVARGHVGSAEEAFARLLGKGGRAYVSRRRPLYGEAIAAILSSGGVPVLAHPHTLGFQSTWQLEGLIRTLVGAGLMGVEAIYPEAWPDLENLCKEISDRLDLLLTGGTDFHGRIKPHIRLGVGRGSLRVPFEWAVRLDRAIQKVKGGFFLDKPGGRG
jgi:predicted metal-dependent phosphoesterase TrpH